MGPPSVVWESVVDGSDDASAPVGTIAGVAAGMGSPDAAPPVESERETGVDDVGAASDSRDADEVPGEDDSGGGDEA